MRGLRLSLLFFRIGVLNELQYRVNFFLQLFQSLVALGTAVAVLALVFRYTDELGGWSPYELLAVMGVHIAVGGLIGTVIQPNMQRLINDVREGTLDYALTKPEDAQLLVSTREFRIWKGVDVLVGAGVIVTAVVRLQREVAPLDALAFVAAVLLGGVMIYCFWLAITVGAFWVVRMEFIVELFDGVYQAGRWPVTIYPGWLRLGFTFLVPLAFAVTVPAEAVTGRLSAATLAAAAAFAAFLALATRWLWRAGLRRYSGASA
ncbi:MAG: ABC-2 family transporter protein [Euzebyales bacterium]|nr:ABC-2 family transporter protein [Euzebyales bacterium]MBA3621191.1 ABC-2 family transporter protein [Euzebyales bacterium]